MPRLSTILAVHAGVAAVAATCLAPRAALAQAAPGYPTGTASVAGQAVDAATNAPVAHTLFGLSRRLRSGANAPSDTSVPLLLVMSDAEGRFVIRDVPAGPYVLLATSPSHIISNYGQVRAAGPSRTLDLAEGERRVELVIPLWRHAIVSGTVRDEAGEPVVGAMVRVLRRMADGPGGLPRYLPGSLATTDDRGRYRITRLTPGEFLVTVPQTQVTIPAPVVDAFVASVAHRGGAAAAGQLVDRLSASSAIPQAAGGIRIDEFLLQSTGDDSPLVVPPPVDGRLSVYPTSYYGAADPVTLSLTSGEERADVDITIQPAPAVRIDGRVTSDAEPAANVVVRLLRADTEALLNDNGFEAAATVTGADGAFTLLGVTPGNYLLKALRLARPRLPPAMAANPALAAAYDVEPPAGETTPLIGARVPLVVGDTDIGGLDVRLGTGATISGRIDFAGGPPPSAEQRGRIGVLLTSEDGGLPGAGFQLARLREDGTFSRAAPAPGSYLLTTVVMPPAWKLASITRGGSPLDGAIDLSGEDVDGVVLTYTDRLASVGGMARNASGLGEISAEVVVFPTDRRSWVREPLNIRSPVIQQVPVDGRFAVPGLLPGDYFVAVVDARDIPEFTGPAFFESVSTFATRVTLTPGQRADFQFTVGRVR